MKTLYITIDTEMDADIHWKKWEPRSFSSVLEGIPQIYRPVWDEYKINPIYFVSPEVVENEACCRILKSEILKGAVIGAHLHPEYIEPFKKRADEIRTEQFPCFDYGKDIEKDKIKNLKDMIFNNLGVIPLWYRAARFGADEDTIEILEELGFKYDSSFTPFIDWSAKGGPNHKDVPITPYIIGKHKIIEYPITIAGRRWGLFGNLCPDNWLFYQWLRPTHMTYIEQRSLIKNMSRKKESHLIMMFHSMEVMINKTPYVRNKWMQDYFIWRLKKTIEFALKEGYQSYSKEGQCV